jgi:hypothetical protein
MRSVSGTPRGFKSPARTQILTLAAITRMTMKLLFTTLTLIVLTTVTVSGQSEFFIKKKKSGRLKKIKSSTVLGFDVWKSDRTKRLGYHGRIIEMTDSTLTIEQYIKPSMRQAKPRIDTLVIRDIRSVKNYLIDNDDFNTLGGMLIIGGVLGLVATPIIWIADGKEAGQEGAIFTAGIFAAGGLLLLPQLIGKRRHMAKWEFVKG